MSTTHDIVERLHAEHGGRLITRNNAGDSHGPDLTRDDGYTVGADYHPPTARQLADHMEQVAGFRPTHINTPYGSFPLVQYRRTRGKQPRVVAVYKALEL